MDDLLIILIAFGPGAALMIAERKRRVERGSIALVLLWTYVIVGGLLMHHEQLALDHHRACENLRRMIAKHEPQRLDDDASPATGRECVRYMPGGDG